MGYFKIPAPDKEYFAKVASEYGDYLAHPLEEYSRILHETGILSESKDKRILEVGCAGGVYSLCLRNLGFKTLVGIDISQELIAIASHKSKGKEGIYFVQADILNLPFKKGAFDIVFSGTCLHHLPHKLYSSALQFSRVLSPKGKVYFFEPYSLCLNSLLRYQIFRFNVTKDEKAIYPNKMKEEFRKAGLTSFKWKKLKKVKFIYLSKTTLENMLVYLRKIVNEYLIPNVCFVGCCQKEDIIIH
jgi:SAM-dependent methyltransferase